MRPSCYKSVTPGRTSDEVSGLETRPLSPLAPADRVARIVIASLLTAFAGVLVRVTGLIGRSSVHRATEPMSVAVAFVTV
jgi:hypothetical protein